MMTKTTDMLMLMRGIDKFYDRCMEETRRKYQLSHIEIKIVSFLNNNPGKDTAADIANLKMLPKGNVSQGVESLIKKGFLRRTPDLRDRRKIHLGFTEEAVPMIQMIDEAKAYYQMTILQGLSDDELSNFEAVCLKIRSNVYRELEEKR